jgi:hypothetical protein
LAQLQQLEAVAAAVAVVRQRSVDQVVVAMVRMALILDTPALQELLVKVMQGVILIMPPIS